MQSRPMQQWPYLVVPFKDARVGAAAVELSGQVALVTGGGRGIGASKAALHRFSEVLADQVGQYGVSEGIDAIVAPAYSFASSPAAVAGYPNISIPIGLTPEGKPAGLWMHSTFLHD